MKVIGTLGVPVISRAAVPFAFAALYIFNDAAISPHPPELAASFITVKFTSIREPAGAYTVCSKVL